MPNIVPHDGNGAVAERPSALPVPANNGALAHIMAGLPELTKGLLAAIAHCKPVPENAEVSYGTTKYNYASSDAIIAEGRNALLAGGCVLLPVSASLNGSERDGPDRFELVRVFVLMHSSGQCAPLQVTWPVIPERGRALDKATAAADTLSLAYLYRDLLAMNRVPAGDDINQRDDRPHQEPRPKPPAKKAPPPTNGTELRQACERAERVWVRDGLCPPNYVLSAMHGWAREEIGCNYQIEDWPADVVAAGIGELKWIKARLYEAAALITATEQKQLSDMLIRKGRQWSAVIRAHKLPDKAAAKDLTRGQWQEIMGQLEEEPDAEPARN